jgi:alkaline phosphatase D
VVDKGRTDAVPELAHSVHVEVEGLRPGREYFYRFRTGAEDSPVGRTRTAPRPNERVDKVRFAFASCQNWQNGLYTAYGHMAEEDLDLVVHLGDYIYEGGVGAGVRPHNGPEIRSIADYRNRHALYKSDANLQAAHSAFPWIATWDDHEVENNYADETPENPLDIPTHMARRAAAYQAYYEHMPLRRAQIPVGPDLRLFRRTVFGDLIEMNVLDTRQYRSDQACGDGTKVPCAGWDDPARTLLGDEQERWLLKGLDRSRRRWNVLAQQIFVARRDNTSGPGETLSMDGWDGYPAQRDRVLDMVARKRVPNVVALTGDVHSAWVNELKADFLDPRSRTIGTEFVGTSISSGGDGSETASNTTAILAENPHIKYYNGRRGYVCCEVTPDRWRADYRAVPQVTTPGAPIATIASFTVRDGRPGVVRTG